MTGLEGFVLILDLKRPGARLLISGMTKKEYVIPAIFKREPLS